jgi:GNAT superfamily N-acetyltransferase
VTFVLRTANAADADAIARVFSPSLRLLTFLPELHTIAEDRSFIEHVILRECDVSVVEASGDIVSFIALDKDVIRLCHTRPDFVGQGAGGFMMRYVQMQGHNTLNLWCFQYNHGGRRFYERHGFVAEQFTDGERNEKKLPDILYRWTKR